MSNLPEPSRVAAAGGQQSRQRDIRKIDDVPARYRSHPSFGALIDDPAHRGDPNGKVLREAMTAIEAEFSGAVKAPVSRSDTPYIDFYDGEGHPFDIKTPLSPDKGDKWEFDPVSNAQTILHQLDMDHPNKYTKKAEPVAVMVDTTYMTSRDRDALWHELRKNTKDDRAVLKRVFEVNVDLDGRKPVRAKQPLTAAQLAVLSGRGR